MSSSSDLERFALKAHQEGVLGGVGMAVHAIPDAFTILHGGVGCKYKHGSSLHAHDLARPSHNICAYTEVTDADLTGGSARRIGPYLRSWHERRRPAFMVVAGVTFLEMTGEDFAAEVAEAAKTVPCETAYLPCLGFEGDLYEGYAAVTLEVLKRLAKTAGPSDPKAVSLAGYFFDRYEMDHEANLAEIRRLLAALGLRLGPVLLSGRPFSELLGAGEAGTILGFPYLGARIEDAGRLCGRPLAAVPLPVGVGGTLRWLGEVAEAAGRPASLVERFARAHEAAARRQLEIFRRRLEGRFPNPRSAVFSDTPLAAGLAALMIEAGLPPVLVGLSDRSLGGRRAFLEAVRRSGAEFPRDAEILENPSLEAVRSGLDREDLAAVLGSTIELNCLPAGGGPGPAQVEIGYPSTRYHAVAPAPYFGIAGALGICQRILNGLEPR